MKKILFTLLTLLTTLTALAQKEKIKITDEQQNNRLLLFASNTSEEDLDVTLTVSGTGFRQSTRKPRAYRVPAASKVPMLSLVIERGKKPVYSYELDVTSELSRRAIRKPATPIKIDPKKPILLYITENCTTCDSIVSRLDSSYYNYRKLILAEKPEVKKTIAGAFKNTVTPYEAITNPIISLGGKLYSEIDSYEALLAALKEEE